jgi:hypothetical protein
MGAKIATLAPRVRGMCRNIHVLHNLEPATSSDEVRAAALQYVRKVSGYAKPSQANQAVFDRAVAEIAHATEHLLADLVTNAPPKDREVLAAQARERAAVRYQKA